MCDSVAETAFMTPCFLDLNFVGFVWMIMCVTGILCAHLLTVVRAPKCRSERVCWAVCVPGKVFGCVCVYSLCLIGFCLRVEL